MNKVYQNPTLSVVNFDTEALMQTIAASPSRKITQQEEFGTSEYYVPEPNRWEEEDEEIR